MHIAAKHGHYLIVKYLKDIGANPVITNRDGHTPYDFADDSRRQVQEQLDFVGKKKGADLTKLMQNLDNLHTIQ
jgi:ankyrin repeat protein